MSKKKKGVSAIDFFCIGFGAIVGVGWAVSINSWMTSCGGAVPAALGYVLVLLMMIPIALCYCELVPMMPVAGGGMTFAYKAFDYKIAGISGWAAFGAFVAIIPWEAIQITDVLGFLIPGIKSGDPLYNIAGSDIYLITILIGTAFSIILFILNMRGLAAAALFQKIMCFLLVGCAVVGAVAAIIGGSFSNLKPVYDISNPDIYGSAADGLKEVSHTGIIGGMFAIVATAPFFLAGFETIPQGVEEAGGDIKKVGKTVVISVLCACLFYAVLLFAFGTGWNWQEFAQMERPAAANMFLVLFAGPTGKVLYWMIVIGALAGLFTTWNGFFMASANLLMGMGRGRIMPKIFAKQNKNDIPVPALVVCLILSLIGPFAGANLIDSITCFSATAFVLSWTLTCWSLVKLRYSEPFMDRPYKIPGGKWMGIFAGAISLVVFVFMFIPSSPFYVGGVSVKMFLIWMGIGVVLFLASMGQRRGMTRAMMDAEMFAKLRKDRSKFASSERMAEARIKLAETREKLNSALYMTNEALQTTMTPETINEVDYVIAALEKTTSKLEKEVAREDVRRAKAAAELAETEFEEEHEEPATSELDDK